MQLWAAYLADRGDLRLRNRLVEHYAALGSPTWPPRSPGKMRFRDRENAVGEVLAALVSYHRAGLRRPAAASSAGPASAPAQADRPAARGAKDEAIFPACRAGPTGRFVPELVPDREQPGCDLDFLELTAELSDQQAAVLWLRHYRGMSVNAVAEAVEGVARQACKRARTRP